MSQRAHLLSRQNLVFAPIRPAELTLPGAVAIDGAITQHWPELDACGAADNGRVAAHLWPEGLAGTADEKEFLVLRSGGAALRYAVTSRAPAMTVNEYWFSHCCFTATMYTVTGTVTAIAGIAFTVMNCVA